MLARRRRFSPEKHQPVPVLPNPEVIGSRRRRAFALAVLAFSLMLGLDSGSDRSVETPPEGPDVILTGFAPFGHYKFNSSQDLVNGLAGVCGEKNWDCLILPDLPVDETNPGAAADEVIRAAMEKMPQGGVIIAFGQTPALNLHWNSLRLEYFAGFSSQSWLRNKGPDPVKYQVSDPVYRTLAGAVEEWEEKNLSPDERLRFRSTFKQKTAGGYICEITAWELMNFSQRQGREGVDYLILFVHVPVFEKLPRSTRMEAAVILEKAIGLYDSGQESQVEYQLQVKADAPEDCNC
jgi:pyrrolidone-carboxylate peptidase